MVFALAGDSTITKFFGIFCRCFYFSTAKVEKRG